MNDSTSKRRLQELEFELEQLRAENIELRKATNGHRGKNEALEQKLITNERNFQAIVNNVSDGIVVADMDSKMFLYANNTFCRMLGYSRSEIMGLGVADVHPKDDLPHVVEQFSRQARGEITLAKNIPVMRKNGDVFYVDINSTPITINGSEFLVGIFRDISEREDAVVALQQSRERYHLLFENTSDAIMLFDTETLMFETANQATLEMFGYTLKEFCSLTVIDISAEKKKTETAVAIITQGQNMRIPRRKFKRKDGSTFYGEIVSSRYVDSNGKEKIVGSVRDITERQQLEEHLIRNQKIEALGTFAAGIAHDFNNILGGIMGIAQSNTYGVDEEDPQIQDYIAIIEACRSGAALIAKLAGFTKRSRITNHPVVVNDIVERVIRFLEKSFRKTVVIKHQLCKQQATVFGDMSAIEHAFTNVCKNAIDAMGEQGELSIKTCILKPAQLPYQNDDTVEEDLFLLVSISDTGIGMDQDTLSKAFDLFFTTKSPGKGSGLGLYLVYKTVNSLGGIINMTSERGAGTTVDIYLPVMNIRESRAEKKVIDPRLQRIDKCVLVVDDDSLILRSYQRIFGRRMRKVFMATNGKDALEIFNEHMDEIDIIFLDLIMPQMDGWQTLKEIRKICKNIPIVIVSGTIKEKAPGASAYMQKPFSMSLLYQILEEALHLS